jgi:hypothetical protein
MLSLFLPLKWYSLHDINTEAAYKIHEESANHATRVAKDPSFFYIRNLKKNKGLIDLKISDLLAIKIG